MRAVRLEMALFEGEQLRIEVDLETYDSGADPTWATAGHWEHPIGQPVDLSESMTLFEVLAGSLVASVGEAIALPFD